MVVNYKNSKIYELVCSVTGKKYIGSTTQKLCQRLSGHKTMNNNCRSRNLINPKIYLLTYVPCDNKEELHAIERLYIENNECINKKIPLRTPKEYKEDNKKHIIETNKQYYKDNKEKLKESHKKYNENHKEHIKEKNKEYREKHREQIREKSSQPIICECGVKSTKSSIVRHRRSKFHQEYENLWN